MKSLLISALIIAAIVVMVGILGTERLPAASAIGDDQLPAAPYIPPGKGFSNTSSFSSPKMIAFCDNINTVAAAEKLRGFSDAQISMGCAKFLP